MSAIAPTSISPTSSAPASASMTSIPVRIRKARLKDAEVIQDLINHFADRGEMLHRTVPEVCENIRDYFVVEESGSIVACSALQVNVDSLAEVKSLAVSERYQGQGLGSLLVHKCLEEAEEIGVPSVFALTYRPGFFERLGFAQIHKSALPRKVWGECIRCPKFPDCGETAVIKEMTSHGGLFQLT